MDYLKSIQNSKDHSKVDMMIHLDQSWSRVLSLKNKKRKKKSTLTLFQENWIKF